MQMLMCRRQIWARRGVVLRMILFAPMALASPKLTTATISTIAATLPTNNTASVRLFVDLENLVIDPASRNLTWSHMILISMFH